MAPDWTKKKGVISGKEAARKADVAKRKANFRKAKKGNSGAAEEIKKSGEKPTGK
jgi:hypothetical protein